MTKRKSMVANSILVTSTGLQRLNCHRMAYLAHRWPRELGVWRWSYRGVDSTCEGGRKRERREEEWVWERERDRWRGAGGKMQAPLQNGS